MGLCSDRARGAIMLDKGDSVGMVTEKCFSQSEVQAIADALGDTEIGLTGSEIAQLLRVVQIPDPDPALTKRHRLLNAFAASQNSKRHRRNILEFIRQSMKPAFHARRTERFEPLRQRLNLALAFAGLAVDASGALTVVNASSTLSEATRRARELRADMLGRDIHPDVLACCREECLADDYFHAIFEATKSIALKIQARTGLDLDGWQLVDRALGGDAPMLAINPHQTQSERSEQKGFVQILKGLFGLFRNPMAHEVRVRWTTDKSDAEEALTLISMAHRRLDRAHTPIRI
jgi:uncharacterized protein (TIGR02391 family)